LAENSEPVFKSAVNRGTLSPDLARTLGIMAQTWREQAAKANPGGVLLEGQGGKDVQAEIDAGSDTVDVDLVESGSLPGDQLNENEVLIIDDGEDE